MRMSPNIKDFQTCRFFQLCPFLNLNFLPNQSIESTGVTFVKGASVRNKKCEKTNNNYLTNKPKDEQAQG